MSDLEDLWPDGLCEDIPSTPADILKRQAALLGPKTKNLVLADVSSRVDDAGDFILEFYLRVPALSNYKFDLFRVYHGVGLYPVTAVEAASYAMGDEEAFSDFISEKLKHPDTIKVVKALISQARSAEDDIPF